jgi:hypothetical protein
MGDKLPPDYLARIDESRGMKRRGELLLYCKRAREKKRCPVSKSIKMTTEERCHEQLGFLVRQKEKEACVQ